MRQWIYLLGFLALAFTLSSCGSNGSGGSTLISTVSGTAAEGKAFANAQVSLKDANGVQLQATTNQSGKYAVQVQGLKPPYLIRVQSGAKTYYSIAFADGTVNIHPYTSLMLQLYYRVHEPTKTLDDIFQDFENQRRPSEEEILQLKRIIHNILVRHLVRVQINPDEFDPIRSPFEADQTGFDKILDETTIQESNGKMTITIDDGVEVETDDLEIQVGKKLSHTQQRKAKASGALLAQSSEVADLLDQANGQLFSALAGVYETLYKLKRAINRKGYTFRQRGEGESREKYEEEEKKVIEQEVEDDENDPNFQVQFDDSKVQPLLASGNFLHNGITDAATWGKMLVRFFLRRPVFFIYFAFSNYDSVKETIEGDLIYLGPNKLKKIVPLRKMRMVFQKINNDWLLIGNQKHGLVEFAQVEYENHSQSGTTREKRLFVSVKSPAGHLSGVSVVKSAGSSTTPFDTSQNLSKTTVSFVPPKAPEEDEDMDDSIDSQLNFPSFDLFSIASATTSFPALGTQFTITLNLSAGGTQDIVVSTRSEFSLSSSLLTSPTDFSIAVHRGKKMLVSWQDPGFPIARIAIRGWMNSSSGQTHPFAVEHAIPRHVRQVELPVPSNLKSGTLTSMKLEIFISGIYGEMVHIEINLS
ncbi:MAG: hypothetical protein D6805_10165 [Planctomycetota bacterium]|nr:MAG: hypothetical protein D6805_10165 [Planctomycetota bacterium]